MIFHKDVEVDEQLPHRRNNGAFVGFAFGF